MGARAWQIQTFTLSDANRRDLGDSQRQMEQSMKDRLSISAGIYFKGEGDDG